MSRRINSSRNSDIGIFGLDVQRDLMRAVTGRPSDAALGTKITGADAVRLSSKLAVQNIPDKCRQLLELSEDKSYRTNYPLVDNIFLLKDKSTIDHLNSILVDRINERNFSKMFFSSPRIPDLMNDDGYLYDFDQDIEPRPDVSLDDWFEGNSEDMPINLSDLKEQRIGIFMAGVEVPIERPSVFSFFIFEVEVNNQLYCLVNSDWFEIDKEHADEVNNLVKQVAVSNISFPVYDTPEEENAYNKKCASSIGGLSLDKDVIVYGGGRSRVEICDVLTKDGKFVHVKKSSASSLLSHLFNQGVVSGQFLLERGFRALCAERVIDDYKLIFNTQDFDPRKIGITFGVITKGGKDIPNSLPFFSKQTLLNARSILGRYGYTVDIAGIEDTT